MISREQQILGALFSIKPPRGGCGGGLTTSKAAGVLNSLPARRKPSG